ncbi:hypothetical protein PVAND_011057 [Polypedilum vanderplanki]|uniref:Spaetzle domain-containing protein n=1 Tax=Polypedilum vanderplanki TaxID=319348 RepID=A0A9J6CHG0_POLVA|nr:hypothetical protein PVAND_011057 [Polypedilum vanderplanki]
MMLLYCLNIILLLSSAKANEVEATEGEPETPEGYYAFIQSPSSFPPTVRPPPYQPVPYDCPDYLNKKPYVSPNNLCGDLNKGKIPKNPMGQNVMQETYPFELIRNQTLKFLSKTLPILKADDTLPKVTQIVDKNFNENSLGDGGISRRTFDDDDLEGGHDLTEEHATNNDQNHHQQQHDDELEKAVTEEVHEEEEEIKSRKKRSTSHKRVRRSKKFCDGGGVFCALYRAIQGEPISSQLIAERREETGQVQPRYEGPPTPCPARVQYVTPVFAKNFQGSWRYVVQIPYEGYFTQTVEVTTCLQTKCHYLDGGCLSSPRWVSLLVAEIFYPQSEDSFSSTAPPSIQQDFQGFQDYLQKRAGVANNDTYDQRGQKKKQQQICDGVDEIGCFQIRLYYDWFLVPGSCKCWRPDYFAKYVKKRPVTPEL